MMLGLVVASLVAFTASLLPIRSWEDYFTRAELAAAVIAVTDDPVEQRQLLKIARFESFFRRDVVTCAVLGPQRERTAWQILPRSDAERAKLCLSFEGDARIALERVRESLRACRELPPSDRLASYARGRCSSSEGRRLSRHRWFDPSELNQ